MNNIPIFVWFSQAYVHQSKNYFSNFGKVPRENWIVTYLLTWPIFRPLKSFLSLKVLLHKVFIFLPFLTSLDHMMADSLKFWPIPLDSGWFLWILKSREESTRDQLLPEGWSKISKIRTFSRISSRSS